MTLKHLIEEIHAAVVNPAAPNVSDQAKAWLAVFDTADKLYGTDSMRDDECGQDWVIRSMRETHARAVAAEKRIAELEDALRKIHGDKVEKNGLDGAYDPGMREAEALLRESPLEDRMHGLYESNGISINEFPWCAVDSNGLCYAYRTAPRPMKDRWEIGCPSILLGKLSTDIWWTETLRNLAPAKKELTLEDRMRNKYAACGIAVEEYPWCAVDKDLSCFAYRTQPCLCAQAWSSRSDQVYLCQLSPRPLSWTETLRNLNP